MYNGNRRSHWVVLFSPNIWNLYQQVRNNKDRTNKCAKAANRSLNTELVVKHLSLWYFINCHLSPKNTN